MRRAALVAAEGVAAIKSRDRSALDAIDRWHAVSDEATTRLSSQDRALSKDQPTAERIAS
jgi:hypothetical protein